MKTKTFADINGKIVATGSISPNLIDLILADGTRFFSTRSDNYSIQVLQNLNIAKIVNGIKTNGN